MLRFRKHENIRFDLHDHSRHSPDRVHQCQRYTRYNHANHRNGGYSSPYRNNNDGDDGSALIFGKHTLETYRIFQWGKLSKSSSPATNIGLPERSS